MTATVLPLPKSTDGDCPWCEHDICFRLSPASTKDELQAKKIDHCPNCKMPVRIRVKEEYEICPSCGREEEDPECTWEVSACRTRADVQYAEMFGIELDGVDLQGASA